MRLSILLAALPVALALPAPVTTPKSGTPIVGRYIIKMKDKTLMPSIKKMLKKDPLHTYDFGNFGGFAADIADADLTLIRNLPGIDYIEQDVTVKASLSETHLDKKSYVTQSSSPWGLARLSHKTSGSTSYTYDSSAGAGTCSYVIDTGVWTTHLEFEGRATFLVNLAGDGINTDTNGHGTHCAGIIGSKTYGVAKKTKIYAVKVLDAEGSGTSSSVLAGINYVATDIKRRNCPNGAVANLSLGGARSTAVNAAAANLVAAGVFMTAASGNEGVDASDTSPASEPTVFTVGATDVSDVFASWSNWGPAVDGQAPGVNILSTWLNGGTMTMSGTSMAAPHVAGLAVYLLAFEGKKSPAALFLRIQALALQNKLTSLPSITLNAVVFNGNPSG